MREVSMSIKDCCISLWNVISWPFRKLYYCFFPPPVIEHDTDEKKVITTLRGGARRRAFKNKTATVFYKALFTIPRKLSKVEEDYKKLRDKEREVARKKRERENARFKILENMEPTPPKPKPRTPSPSTDS
jgi:hypothetical protein